MNLEFFVKDKKITRKGLQTVVADTSGHYTFSIAFDKEWEGLIKLVVFQNGSETAQMLYTGQTWLPDNVSGRGDLYVACHGYRDLQDRAAVIRTVRMTRPVRIASAGPKGGSAPEIYTPTLLEQILLQTRKAEDAGRALENLRAQILAMLESGQLKGADGCSFVLQGRYDTLQQLLRAHPVGKTGEAWVVGSEENNRVVFWSQERGAWETLGTLRGPEGPAGQAPVIGENGNWWSGGVDTGVHTQGFSGRWEDLEDKPVLFSGSYADLTGKPTLFSGSYSDLTDIPTGFPPAAHSHTASDINSGTFAAARIPSLAASKISAGTFAGQVAANASGQAPGTSLVRNSRLVATEETPTVNGEIFWTYG